MHYYPYGGQANTFRSATDELRYKFTGHERDRNGEFSTVAGPTDYMLGRTYGYPFFVFMQVDPARDGWNLYGYVGGNPVKFVDPDGLQFGLINYRVSQHVGRDNVASAGLGLTPVLGDIKDGQEAVLGVDLVTGKELTAFERVLAGAAAALPFVNGKLLREGTSLLLRNGDGAGQGARAAQRPGGRAPEFPGGQTTESGFLDAAEEYLGNGYVEASPGRFVSADGLRQVRFGAHEVRSTPLHGHFEAFNIPQSEGGRVIENTVIQILSD